MNREQYRAAFDQVKFRDGFQRETADLLLSRTAQRQEKENSMNTKQIKRAPLIAAALAAVLVVSAAAATLLLRPADVARQVGNDALAAAFESPGAVKTSQSVESGDYRFTFSGLVSGAGLSELTEDVDAQRTYAVVAAARVDGQPMGSDGVAGITATPLVSGYLPWSVNAWTLNGGYTAFTQDGITYYLYEYDSLEVFAGRTVYLAVYEGGAPNADMFNIAPDGGLAFQDSFTAPHALFTVPLDAARANPSALAELEASLREQGLILTPAELEAALAEQDGGQPSAVVEPEGEGSFVITEG